SGLYHFNVGGHGRDYSTVMGRPMQADPAGYPDGMSRYEWEMSGPIAHLDPSGLDIAIGAPPIEQITPVVVTVIEIVGGGEVLVPVVIGVAVPVGIGIGIKNDPGLNPQGGYKPTNAPPGYHGDPGIGKISFPTENQPPSIKFEPIGDVRCPVK